MWRIGSHGFGFFMLFQGGEIAEWCFPSMVWWKNDAKKNLWKDWGLDGLVKLQMKLQDSSTEICRIWHHIRAEHEKLFLKSILI